MFRAVKRVLLAGSMIVAFSSLASALAQPCIGAPTGEPAGGLYPEQRIFLESQSWWVNVGEPPFAPGTDHGHIHLGVCFPYKRTLRGKIQLNLRVILHDSNGTINFVRISDAENVKWLQKVSLSCPDNGTCTWWIPVLFDTSLFDYDGRREFRFTANIPSGGFPDSSARMFQSTGWQAYLANGKPVQDYRSSDLTIGRGWYTGSDYTNAQMRTDLPLTPVGGFYSPVLNFSESVTQCDVLLDPDFHAIPPIPGILLFQGSTDVECTVLRAVTINTLALPNGIHRLVLRAKVPVVFNGQPVMKMGIQVAPFQVKN